MGVVLWVHKEYTSGIEAAGGLVTPESDIYEYALNVYGWERVKELLVERATPYAISVDDGPFESFYGFTL